MPDQKHSRNAESTAKDGGILVAPVGEAGKEILLKVTRNGDQFKMEELMAVRFVPMVAGTAS